MNIVNSLKNVIHFLAIEMRFYEVGHNPSWPDFGSKGCYSIACRRIGLIGKHIFIIGGYIHTFSVSINDAQMLPTCKMQAKSCKIRLQKNMYSDSGKTLV